MGRWGRKRIVFFFWKKNQREKGELGFLGRGIDQRERKEGIENLGLGLAY